MSEIFALMRRPPGAHTRPGERGKRTRHRARVGALLFAGTVLLAGAPSVALARTGIAVIIRTVPRVKSVRFELDGRPFFSDASGVARTSISRAGAHTLSVRAPAKVSPKERVEFAQWSDGKSSAIRSIELKAPTTLWVGFDTSYLVATTFSDASGKTVAPSAVDAFVAVDDSGGSHQYPAQTLGVQGPTAPVWQRHPAGTRWLPGGQTVRSNGAIENRRISYEVTAVQAGDNHFQARSQPFSPAIRASWSIEVEAYQTDLAARDLLFGFSQGTKATLTYPDGRRATTPVEAGAPPALLSKGSYVLAPEGAGFALDKRFVVPASGRITATVLGYPDIAVVVLVLLVGGWIVMRLRRRAASRGGLEGHERAATRAERSVGDLRGAAAPEARPQPQQSQPVRSAQAMSSQAAVPVASVAVQQSGPAAEVTPAGGLGGNEAKRAVRVRLRNGRTIEGWKEGGASAVKEVMIVEVQRVFDRDGNEVSSTPLDSFLLSSQVSAVEDIEPDSAPDESTPRSFPAAGSRGASEEASPEANGGSSSLQLVPRREEMGDEQAAGEEPSNTG